MTHVHTDIQYTMGVFPEWKVYQFDSTKTKQVATHLNIDNFQSLPILKAFSVF